MKRIIILVFTIFLITSCGSTSTRTEYPDAKESYSPEAAYVYGKFTQVITTDNYRWPYIYIYLQGDDKKEYLYIYSSHKDNEIYQITGIKPGTYTIQGVGATGRNLKGYIEFKKTDLGKKITVEAGKAYYIGDYTTFYDSKTSRFGLYNYEDAYRKTTSEIKKKYPLLKRIKTAKVNPKKPRK
ncbi:MAG TPA: hypothetical protein P5123_05810 [Spirochaetota bacterium]|nr:hypothetical protein [Spirochaetota bacterium]